MEYYKTVEQYASQWLWTPLPEGPESNIQSLPPPVTGGSPVHLKMAIQLGFPFMMLIALGFIGGFVDEDTFKASCFSYEFYVYMFTVAISAYIGAVVMEEGKLYEVFAHVGVILQSWLIYAAISGYSEIKDADLVEAIIGLLTFALLLYKKLFK